MELFAGTVRDNVTLFDDEPTDDDVVDALRSVGLDALADGGIGRPLGAAGTGLSAGEAQLLALARVWLRNPDMVVLDEATARVDPETERRLEAAVVELMKGRTTLVIAHRLTTLRSVDEIIVFDHGRIVEHGDRLDLVGDDDSRFAQLLSISLDRDGESVDGLDLRMSSRHGHLRESVPDGGGVVTVSGTQSLVEHPRRTSTSTRPIDEITMSDNVWKLTWRVSQHRPREFWLGWFLFVVFFTMPAITGYFLGRGYSALAAGDTTETIWWAAAIAVSETIRMVAIHHGALIWTKAWIHMQTLLRANMLSAQMASGGIHAGQPVGSSGAAVTHFRDDTEDVANFVDGMVDVSGGVVFTVIAGFVLASADPSGAVILIIPLLGVGIATRVLDSRIKEYRIADRRATEQVTGLLGDVMAAATTIKVNDAAEPMMARLAVLVDRRRYTAVRDRVLEEGVQAFSQGAADIGLGLVLLVSAGRHRVGHVRPRHPGAVRGVPRLVELPAQDDRTHAGAPQAGRGGVRSDAQAGRGRSGRQHRARSSPADRSSRRARSQRRRASRASAARTSRCRRAQRAVRRPDGAVGHRVLGRAR